MEQLTPHTLLSLDDCIIRAQLALAYLRQRLTQHGDLQTIETATRRLRAIAICLADMACAAGEDTQDTVPYDLRVDTPLPQLDLFDSSKCLEVQPQEDPTVFYKVWVEIERIDEKEGTYEDMSKCNLVSPKSLGTFTSLRQAMEQAMSLQGVYGGVLLHSTDYSELQQAEKLEEIASQGMEDHQAQEVVEIQKEMPSVPQPPQALKEVENTFGQGSPAPSDDEEYGVADEDIPAPTGDEDD